MLSAQRFSLHLHQLKIDRCVHTLSVHRTSVAKMPSASTEIVESSDASAVPRIASSADTGDVQEVSSADREADGVPHSIASTASVGDRTGRAGVPAMGGREATGPPAILSPQDGSSNDSGHGRAQNGRSSSRLVGGRSRHSRLRRFTRVQPDQRKPSQH